MRCPTIALWIPCLGILATVPAGPTAADGRGDLRARGTGSSGPALERAAAARQDRDPTAAQSCGRCHTEIYREWQGRAHGRAFDDPIYQRALKERRRPERCLPCHVPDSVQARLGKQPNARAGNRSEGVTCVSCHAAGEQIAGPFGARTDAHPTVKHPAFTDRGSVSLCASCHATKIGPVLPVARDFQAARLGDEGESCIGCHMPPVERPLAVDPATGEPHGERRLGRQHTVLGPGDAEFCKKAFAVEVRRDGSDAVLAVANEAGHRVPGLTLREFPFTLTLCGEDGKALAEHRVSISAENGLKVRETREFRFPLPAGASRAEVRIEHRFEQSVQTIATERFAL